MHITNYHIFICTLIVSTITFSYSISCFGGRRLLKQNGNFDSYDCPSLTSCYARIIFFNDSDTDAVLEKGCVTPGFEGQRQKECKLGSTLKSYNSQVATCICEKEFCNDVYTAKFSVVFTLAFVILANIF